jgi:hypothetical protein
MDLLPKLWREKLSQAIAKRNRSRSHKPFLLEGWVTTILEGNGFFSCANGNQHALKSPEQLKQTFDQST